MSLWLSYIFFFFNDTATTEIYTLSLHDALPISAAERAGAVLAAYAVGLPAVVLIRSAVASFYARADTTTRSEEHTSELQSRQYLVCRLLLEKKKKNHIALCISTISHTLYTDGNN